MNKLIKIVLILSICVTSACSNGTCDDSKAELTPEKSLRMFYEFQGREEQLMDPLILGGKGVIPLIITEVKNKSMSRRRYAIAFLGNSGSREALPVLESILGERSEADLFRGDALLAVFMIDAEKGKQYAAKNLSENDYVAVVSQDIISDASYIHDRRKCTDALNILHGAN